MSCDRGIDVGTFVLHAMEADEAADFTRHLQACAECRAEVEQLQMVVDTLPVAAPQLAPPPELRDRIMREVRVEAELLRAAGPEADRVPERAPRRGWRELVTLRPSVAAALSAALIAVGVGGGAIVMNDGAPSSRSVVADVTAPGAAATLSVKGSRGTLHVAKMPSPPAGSVYQVWFIKDGKKPIPTHTLFNVRGDGNANVEIDESVDGVKQVLVTAEPSGGSMQPSSAPIISAAAPT